MAEMIGRAHEAEAIARFAEHVADGPIGLMIEGEPGIGKTTVWLEAVRIAGARGYRVLKAQPAESEAELSFAALGDLVGAVFDDVRADLPLPQRQALEVALLRVESGTPPDQRTTATALVGVLAMLSTDRPLVLAVDDVQWLDPASKRAVEFAARRLPARVGIVVTSRAGGDEAIPLGLDRAFGPERFEHLSLGPLSLAALHHLFHQAHGIKLPRPTLARVADVSRGNPFYALEIARAIARGGGPPALGDAIPLSPVLRDLVSDRLHRLSSRAREATLAAAALSRPTGTSIAAALAPDVDATAALLEAEEAGILGWEGDRLRFTHPLLASAIYGSAASGRRRALHRRLAEVVADQEERARHLARGVASADGRVAQEIEEAARLAERRGAPEAAAELFEAARRLTPDDRSEDLARRMVGGANALAIAGDLNSARSLATTALQTAPPGSVRARALFVLGSLASYTETIEARTAYHERALTEAGDDLALRAEILLSLIEGISVDPERATRRADEAIELLRERGDPSLLAQALMNKFVAEAVLGRGARGDLLAEALALEARSAGQPLLWPLIWSHWIDDLDMTRERYRLQEERCQAQGDAVGAAEIVEFLSMAQFRAGQWDDAERALEQACVTLGQLELRGPVVASFADRAVIDAHRGRVERARKTLTDNLQTERLDVFWRMVCHSAQGAVEFCAGDHEAAARAWEAMSDEAGLVGWKDNLEDRSEPDRIEALLALGQPVAARSLLRDLEWRGRTLPRAWIDATLPRAQALILAAEGRPADAIAVLDEAPPVSALPFERARLLLVRGQIERRANRKTAAKESLSAALATFEQLGSPPWVQRTRAEIARLGLRHRDRVGLTATERRIAELAATGMTNRQVADAVFVSPKTVEANLARIYGKLGIRSRAELGARMAAKPGVGVGET